MFKYDWNGNGRRDIADEYIDYMIFQEVTKDGDHDDYDSEDDSKDDIPIFLIK